MCKILRLREHELPNTLHTSKRLVPSWRWPIFKAETCRSMYNKYKTEQQVSNENVYVWNITERKTNNIKFVYLQLFIAFKLSVFEQTKTVWEPIPEEQTWTDSWRANLNRFLKSKFETIPEEQTWTDSWRANLNRFLKSKLEPKRQEVRRGWSKWQLQRFYSSSDIVSLIAFIRTRQGSRVALMTEVIKHIRSCNSNASGEMPLGAPKRKQKKNNKWSLEHDVNVRTDSTESWRGLWDGLLWIQEWTLMLRKTRHISSSAQRLRAYLNHVFITRQQCYRWGPLQPHSTGNSEFQGRWGRAYRILKFFVFLWQGFRSSDINQYSVSPLWDLGITLMIVKVGWRRGGGIRFSSWIGKKGVRQTLPMPPLTRLMIIKNASIG
jgi:hypothetical protein